MLSRPAVYMCDVIVTRGSSRLGGAIRWAQRTRGEGPSRVNHAAIGVEWPDTIIEADWRGRRCSLWDYHADDGIIIYRPISLSDDQKLRIVVKAAEWVGRPYPVAQLFGFLIDNKIFGGRQVARRLLINRLAVCSRLVALAFKVEGLDFGKPDPDPDDIDDFCSTHPQHYAEVYRQNMENVDA